METKPPATTLKQENKVFADIFKVMIWWANECPLKKTEKDVRRSRGDREGRDESQEDVGGREVHHWSSRMFWRQLAQEVGAW